MNYFNVILNSFSDLKFNIGKKNFIDFLKGDTNKTIEKHNLFDCKSYGILYELQTYQITNLVDFLIENEYISLKKIIGDFFVLEITQKGEIEIYEKKLTCSSDILDRKNSIFDFDDTTIDDDDLKDFEKYDDFLKDYNVEQKKAIIDDSKNILCVAGAGCGKTLVLTKRIEFLINYKNAEPKKILAITFTKKARFEMKKRLLKNGIKNVRVETFNSFCEKFLKTYSKYFYDKERSVINFSDKIKILNEVLSGKKIEKNYLIENYFSKRQLEEKDKDTLFLTLTSDLFSIIEIYKNCENGVIKEFFKLEKNYSKKVFSRQIYEIVTMLNEKVKTKNLRDFSDQLFETNFFLEKFKQLNPEFAHILVDEFQDINLVQFSILKNLYCENIFCVGDPRQAIYGFRGSQTKFLDDFLKFYKNVKVIFLKKNYRSNNLIVDFSNKIIESLNLVNLESNFSENENSIFLVQQKDFNMEYNFIVEALKNSKNNFDEIFVLARTNKILEDFSKYLIKEKIPFHIKNEEEEINFLEEKIILSTIHSIKGQEAKEVYLIGATSQNFPNKTTDNFILSLVKNNLVYDKYLEELRLFYVGITRAKQKLVITYTQNLTPFLKEEVFDKIKHIKLKDENTKSLVSFGALKKDLIEFRRVKSEELSVPLYIVFSNKSIDDICEKLPKDKYELSQINGFGDVKVLKYGDEILRLVNG